MTAMTAISAIPPLPRCFLQKLLKTKHLDPIRPYRGPAVTVGPPNGHRVATEPPSQGHETVKIPFFDFAHRFCVVAVRR